MPKTKPRVSVIIASFNSVQFLEETIDSVLNQSLREIEVIVIDDCSNDGSAKIISDLAKKDVRVRPLKTSHNSGGPATPRNIGMSVAQGEFIAFLDADDIWEPGKLTIQLSHMKDDTVAVFSGFDQIDSLGNLMKKSNGFLCWIQRILIYLRYRGLFISNQYCLSTSLLRKDVVQDIKFDEDSLMHAVEDYGLWLNLFRQYPDQVVFVGESLARYRVHAGSLSSGRLRQHIRSIYCLCKHCLQTDSFKYIGSFLVGIFALGLRCFWAGFMDFFKKSAGFVDKNE